MERRAKGTEFLLEQIQSERKGHRDNEWKWQEEPKWARKDGAL